MQVTADNAFFIFLSIPHGIETTPWQWEEYKRMAAGTNFESKIDKRHPENKIGSILASHNIDHLFLRSTFENHLQTINKNASNHYLAYRKGLGHLNETGNLLMTDALIDHLSTKGIIKQLIDKNNAHLIN